MKEKQAGIHNVPCHSAIHFLSTSVVDSCDFVLPIYTILEHSDCLLLSLTSLTCHWNLDTEYHMYANLISHVGQVIPVLESAI